MSCHARRLAAAGRYRPSRAAPAWPGCGARAGGSLAGRALVAIVLLGALPCSAQGAGAWQTHIRVKDFTDLLVTDQAVWAATAEAGLWRLDRATLEFRSITREPGLVASNHLTSLAVDRVGRLWVGTREAGLSRLSADGARWDLVNAFDGLPVDSVTTLTVVGDTLWIGTRRGIALWDGRQVLGSLPDGNTVSFDTTFATPAITGVAQLGDTLWLSTPRGVGFARTRTNLTDWRRANAGLPTLEVRRLASDGQAVFALAGGSVFRWEPDSLKWLSEGFTEIVHNLEEEHGTVLAATRGGLWWRRAGSPAFERLPGSPAAPGVRDDPEPAVDPTGARYYAGSRDTLWEQPAAASDTAWVPHVPPGPPGNAFTHVVIDGPRVYAATRSEGIGRWDGSRWFHWPPVFCGDCPNTFRFPVEVFAMVVDRLGRKWVACWSSAVERFDDSLEPPRFTHLWTAPGDDFRHTLAFGAAADDTGGVWFGMDTNNLGVVQPLGLDHYNAAGDHVGTWGPGAPPGSLVRGGKIRAVTVDKTGRVWVGYAGAANSGVDHFTGFPEAPNADFKSVSGTTSLDVWALVAHGDSIWVLTDRDLRRIQRVSPRVVQTLATPAGRPLGARLMDVAGNGDLFVGSEEGVRWYRTDGTTQDLTVTNSPLASNDVRAVAVERATGAVWFGTAGGLNRFDPGYRPPEPPPGAPDTLRIYPNPATLIGVGLQLRLRGTAAAYSGAIYDVRGRLVRRFTTRGAGEVFWDGRDRAGALVMPGIYFVRAEGGGRQARARFVLLR